MGHVDWPSLPAMFFEQVATRSGQPFLWAKWEGTYRPLSWDAVAARTRSLAQGLRALGIAPGDRVALVSENRPEWLIADLAVMSVGAITVPTFTTNTVADHRHTLTQSGAKAAILSGRTTARRLLPAALEAPELSFVLSIEPLEIAQRHNFRVLGWEEVAAKGREVPDDLAEMIAGL